MIAGALASQARFRPKRMAVVDGDRSVTYRQLAERSSRLAAALGGLGCQPGDRVALVAANSLENIEWFFACAAGGYLGLAVNTRLGTGPVADMLTDAEPAAVIIDGRSAELGEELRARGVLPPVQIGYGTGHGCPLEYEQVLLGARDGIHLPQQPPDTPLLLTATSGTTGRPKMTVHSHLGVFTGLQCAQASLCLNDSSRTLTALPMFFATATGGYWLAIFMGAQVHLLSAFDAEQFVEVIDRAGITHSIVGPSPLYQVMDTGKDLAPLRRMDLLGAGGAPFDPSRYMDLHEQLDGTLAAMYSMSELSVSTILHPDDVRDGRGGFNDKVGSVGRPQPGGDVRVLDDAGNDVVADGEAIGEVVFSAPGIARGYWGNPPGSEDTFVDGMVRSGDLGSIDEDGFLRIVDRKKDLIVSGGINIAPLEIEHVLTTHPGVRSAAVIGVDHPMWGEAVHAVVVREPGTDAGADEIVAWASERLASVKKPRSIEFVDEIPVSATGKVLRRQLREERKGREGPADG